MQCLTAQGRWAPELVQCSASLPRGSGKWNFCNALPYYLGAGGSATHAMRCLTAWGHGVVELLGCLATLSGGSGECNSCIALPHCPGNGHCNSCDLCHNASGQWAVLLFQCTTTLPGGKGAMQVWECTASLSGDSGQWDFCNALPHCPGAGGCATLALYCPTTLGHWAVELLHCTASPLGGTG